VLCTTAGTGDTSAEKKRAQGKSDLFFQAFEKVLEIR
jgi:hypothetical protein